MSKDTRSIHQRVGDLLSLAQTYADDGGFLSAARVVRQAADALQAHGEKINAELEQMSQGRS